MRTRAIAVVGAAVLAIAAGVFLTRPPEVEATTARRGTAVVAAYATGTVEARTRRDLNAKVAGSVESVLVRAGDVVSEGQLLVRVDASTLRHEREVGEADLYAARRRAAQAPQVASLRAQIRALETQQIQARDDLARLESLTSNGASTQQALDHARQRRDSLAAQITAVEAQIQDLEIGIRADAARQTARVAALSTRLGDSELRSPIAGVVLDVMVEPGEVVAVNQAVARIGDLRDLWIEAYIDEGDIGRVREGMAAVVRMDSFPDETFSARVAAIAPDADRQRKAFEVDIELVGEVPGLRSGMSAEVNVIVERRENALLVPLAAVRDGSVWTLDRESRLRRKPVRLGSRDLLVAEVLDGLVEGEAVVVDPVSMSEGTRVRRRAQQLAVPVALR